MPAVDYRSLQAPEQVRTDLPDNGAAARAAATAAAFREFEGVSFDVAGHLSTQAGALAGAAAGNTGHPQYKQGLARLTAYGNAFNNAATGAYAVAAEAQADDAAARLRVQANNDPDTFRATYSAVRDAVLKQAPRDAVPMLTELYNKRLAAGLAAVSGEQAAEQHQLQRQAYDSGIARDTSRVALLMGSTDVHDQLEGQDEHVKLSLKITGGVEAGLYSKAEAESMQINAERSITAQIFSTQIDRELAKPPEESSIVDVMNRFRQGHIDNLNDPNTPAILSEAEYQKLFADATTKVREWNLIYALNKREGKTAEQLKWEAGDDKFTELLLRGQLTERMLADAVHNHDLKDERATSLRSQMQQGETNVKSNQKALYDLHTDPLFLDMSAGDISDLPSGPGGINFTDKLKAIQEIERRKAGWEGTPAAKQGKSAIDAALKILPGTPNAALSDEQKHARVEAQQEYIEKMNALKPSEVQMMAGQIAKEVVKHVQQKEAAADLTDAQNGLRQYIKAHGPGSADAWSDDKYQRGLKQHNDAVSAAAAAVKGP